jgi:hypothetical protein
VDFVVGNSGTGAVLLRKAELPFLSAHLERLNLFTRLTQHALLKLATDVRLYNEVVDDVRRYAALTFDASVIGESRKRVDENLGCALDIGARRRFDY